MQRVRQVIDQRDISLQSAAGEIGVSYANLREWLSGFRSLPGQDRLVLILVWLYRYQPKYVSKVFGIAGAALLAP